MYYTQLKNENNKFLKNNYNVSFNDSNNFYYIFENKHKQNENILNNLNKI